MSAEVATLIKSQSYLNWMLLSEKYREAVDLLVGIPSQSYLNWMLLSE